MVSCLLYINGGGAAAVSKSADRTLMQGSPRGVSDSQRAHDDSSRCNNYNKK